MLCSCLLTVCGSSVGRSIRNLRPPSELATRTITVIDMMTPRRAQAVAEVQAIPPDAARAPHAITSMCALMIGPSPRAAPAFEVLRCWSASRPTRSEAQGTLLPWCWLCCPERRGKVFQRRLGVAKRLRLPMD